MERVDKIICMFFCAILISSISFCWMAYKVETLTERNAFLEKRIFILEREYSELATTYYLERDKK